MTKAIALWVLAALGSVLLAAACTGSSTEIDGLCTDLPCPAGLWVQLDGTAADEYSIAAHVAGAAPWVKQCSLDDPCDYIVLPDFTPQTVDIVYSAHDTTITMTVSPQYETSRPNGRGCGECRRATIVMPVQAR